MPTPYARHAQRTPTRPAVIVGYIAAILGFVVLCLGIGVLIAFALTGELA